MRCSNCGADNSPTNRHCTRCGTTQIVQCLKCKFGNAPDAIYCGGCGVRLADDNGEQTFRREAAPVRSEGGGADSPDFARKTVTVLFADIKGSTSVIENMDPEEALDLLRPVVGAMVEAVVRLLVVACQY